jgi:hexosaminidase
VTAVQVAIIPRPFRVTELPEAAGVTLADGLVISYAAGLGGEARWFRSVLEAGTGWNTSVVEAVELGGGRVELRLGDVGDAAADLPAATHAEAYRLRSADGRVVITSSGCAGMFYGLQTLRQLLPDSVLVPSSARPSSASPPIELPALEVVDAPRFPWRGVHLDVARHFMPKSFILKLIDLAALHKCNVLHLHLTDDQGWRLPVARYPRLTEIGAWRGQPDAGDAESLPSSDEGLDGGFYSRDDLTEIVAFAAERHVNVLPEVDMPGHTVAAIAAYPELGNTADRLSVWTSWGISAHVLNLEESTLSFCADVIDEVVGIFPWDYVHLGGDECPTDEWKSRPRARALMHENGYTSERQLQGWFTARMAAQLGSRGRTLVGWSEIIEGGAPQNAIVMAWRSEEDAVKAAAAGHDVVATPQEWLYFDRPYSEDPAEPRSFPGAISVEKVYEFDPLPAAASDLRQHLLGAQCELWTEFVTTTGHAEYMYFPRLCAFAETVWTPETAIPPKSYAEFLPRLTRHLRRLDVLGVSYRPWTVTSSPRQVPNHNRG